MRKIGLVVLLFLTAMSLSAAPTIYGGTGLYRVFSADVGKQQRLQFSFHVHAFYQDILATSRAEFYPANVQDSVDYSEGYDTYGGGDIDFAIGYSITKYLEMFVHAVYKIDGLDESEDVRDTFNLNLAAHGFGDVTVGLKFDIMPLFTDQEIFHFGILPFVTIPTGQKAGEFTPYEDIQFNREFTRFSGGLYRYFSSGDWDYGLHLLGTIYTPSEVPLELTGNVGYVVHTKTLVGDGGQPATSADRSYFNEWVMGAGFAFHFPGFTPFVELSYRRGVSLTGSDLYPTIPARKRVGYVTGGFRFESSSGVVFDLVGDYLIFGDFDSIPDLINNTYIPTGYGAAPLWCANLGISYFYDYYKPEPPAPPKPEKPKPVVVVKNNKTIVTGTVVDRATGDPLEALISFPGTAIPVVNSDSNGIYKIEINVDSIPDKILRIRCKKPGYSWKEKTVTLIKNQPVVVDFELKKKEVAQGTIMGKIIDANGDKPMLAKVSFPENANIRPVLSNANTGIYKITLPPGTYVVSVEADGYISQTVPIVVKDKDTVLQNFRLIKKTGKITLHGIRFASGKATIRPESYPILDQAVALLQQNPSVKIEIQGHTDSVGSASYNLRLSQMRAESVRNYLISHGIAPDRLIAKGYGESMPIADNGTREGRAQNRRIEFKIISY